MPRTVTEAVETQITSDPNSSIWLVYLGFESGLYLTSWGSVLTYDGHNYQPWDVRVRDLQISPDESKGTLEIGNMDNAIGFYAANYGLMDIVATIYQAYVNSDGEVVANPELLLSGRTNGGNWGKEAVTINIEENKSARRNVLPIRFITAENGFHHLPYRGMRIVFADEIYELKDF